MSDRACTLPRTTGDMYVEVSDGRFTAMTLATPADIAAGHVRCASCDSRETGKRKVWPNKTLIVDRCMNQASPCWLREVNPTTDYCPHHSEIER